MLNHVVRRQSPTRREFVALTNARLQAGLVALCLAVASLHGHASGANVDARFSTDRARADDRQGYFFYRSAAGADTEKLPGNLLASTRAATGGGNPASPVVSGKMSLPTLVSIAVLTHPSVKARSAEHDAATADVQSARWQYFPSASVGAKRDNDDRTSMIAAVQQPLWAGGRIDAGLDAATAKARSADMAVVEARYNLALMVANSYQTMLQHEARSEVFRRSVRFHEDQAQSIRRRVEGGISAQSDLDLVHARLAQMKSELVSAQSLARISIARLSQLTGQTLTSVDIDRFPVDGKVDAYVRPRSLDDLLDDVAKTHPALRRLDADIETAQHEVRVKRASMFPTFSLRAERERNDGFLVSTGNKADSRILLVFDFVPGAGLSALSVTDAAQARATGMGSSRDSAYRELIDRVSTEFDEFNSALNRRVDLLSARKAAMEVLASYSRQFEAGKRGWLDVMNAARELTQADVALTDVDAQLVAGAYRLKLHAGEVDWGAAPSMQDTAAVGR